MFGSLAWLLALGCGAPRDAAQPVRPAAPARATLYQYSVMDALLAGVFDGDLSVAALKQHGDFGLGTFNQLDGEMLVYRGAVYRVRGDGSVHAAADTDRSPNAWVTWFEPRETIALDGAATLAEVKAELARRLRPNRSYAIELHGRFTAMTTRAPDAATPPYPELTAHLASHQRTFALANTEGAAIGFLLPGYVARVSVPGLHLHYLADDHASGGHVLDFQAAPGVAARVMQIANLDVEFSTNAQFDQADLSKDRQHDTQRVETGNRK
jgi:acetolactate decarboxylase